MRLLLLLALTLASVGCTLEIHDNTVWACDTHVANGTTYTGCQPVVALH